eukprot:GFUD01043390.1.p1 GENE.GFUD01043390.1~~GFUD01043390.1.p1  ORF type:complete len:149 (+),score=41.15 GFUD01043390.1:47-493(+)
MSFKESQLPEDAINTKEIDSIYKFLAHIDWNEPFMQGLVIFHVLAMVTILRTRKRVWIQGFLFTVLLVSISLTERANEWLATNFKLYAKLQYFDSQGMFISLTYSAPVLVNCVIILINWFFISGDMLVKVKRKQIEVEAKKGESKKEK